MPLPPPRLKEVQGDILGQLHLDNPLINIASVDRANLTYRIEMRSEIIHQITGVLKNTPGRPGLSIACAGMMLTISPTG